MRIQRRDLLKVIGASGALYLVARMGVWPNQDGLGPVSEIENGPIQTLKGEFSVPHFTGDQPQAAHQRLWDLENYIASRGGWPKEVKTAPIAIVGGGMSGLLSAYRLRDLKPVIFEQADQFGGNSKAEVFDGNSFSLGAAYISSFSEGSWTENFLREMGVLDQVRNGSEGKGSVLWGDRLVQLWSGESDPQSKAQFAATYARLQELLDQNSVSIPPVAGEGLPRPELDKLDSVTAQKWLHKNVPNLHPHLEEFLELYAYSSFGGSLTEISAAHFLYFFSGDFSGISVFPAGNATIAQGLYSKLKTDLGAEALHPQATVLEVRNSPDGHVELLIDTKGKLELWRSQFAIIATQKFIAKHIVKDAPTEQKKLWSKLRYRSYIVANVLLDKKGPPPGFDIYALSGSVRSDRSSDSPVMRTFADVCFYDWVREGRGSRSILTLYRPYPMDGARAGILQPSAFQDIEQEITQDLTSKLPGLGFTNHKIAGVRLTRWGHALPLAEPGFISKGGIEKIGAPFKKIFFANQDNLVSPCFESCLAASEAAAKAIRAVWG